MYQKIVKFCIYALVFLVPVFWLPFTSEPFELNKTYLLFFLASGGILAWWARMIFQDKKIQFSYTLLDFFVLGYLVIMILTTVFSKDRVASIFGSYGRFWPSLLGILTLGGFYFLITNNVRTKNMPLKPKTENDTESTTESQKAPLHRVLNFFLLSCGLVVLMSYLSIFGVWGILAQQLSRLTNTLTLPLVMTSKGFNPVSISLEGVSIFLAFVLVLLLGLSIFKNKSLTGKIGERKIGERGKEFLFYFFIMAVLGILIIVDFWPAWLCLVGSLAVFLGVSLWKRLFKKDVNKLTLPILCFLVALTFLMSSPLKGWVAQNKTIGNLPREVFLRQKMSWFFAWQGLKENPLLGSGVSNFSYTFAKFKPETFLEDNPLWRLRLDKAGNHIAELVATTGAIGVFSYFVLIALFLTLSYWSIAKNRRLENMIFLTGFVALLVGQFVYYQNVTVAFAWWLMIGLGAINIERANFSPLSLLSRKIRPSSKGATKKDEGEEKRAVLGFKDFPEMGLMLSIIWWIVLGAVIFLYFNLSQNYIADVYYRQYLTNPFQNLNKLKKAAHIASDNSVYHITLARAYLANFTEELAKSQPDPQTVGNMVSLAVGETKKAVQLSPQRVAVYETAGIVYRDIQGMVQGAAEWAIKSFERAISLEPKNPALLVELGKLYSATNDNEKAAKLFEEAIGLKKDYVNGYIQLALLSEKQNEIKKAQQILENFLSQNIASVEARFQLGRLYYNDNKDSQAEQQFLAALQLFPDHSNSLYALGLVYQKRGDLAAALTAFRKVLVLNPGNREVLSKIEELERMRAAAATPPEEERERR